MQDWVEAKVREDNSFYFCFILRISLDALVVGSVVIADQEDLAIV